MHYNRVQQYTSHISLIYLPEAFFLKGLASKFHAQRKLLIFFVRIRNKNYDGNKCDKHREFFLRLVVFLYNWTTIIVVGVERGKMYAAWCSQAKDADVTMWKYVTPNCFHSIRQERKLASLWEMYYLFCSVSRKLWDCLLGKEKCHKTVNFLQSNGGEECRFNGIMDCWAYWLANPTVLACSFNSTCVRKERIQEVNWPHGIFGQYIRSTVTR